MKFVVCLLVVLPLALCAPSTAEEEDVDKRFLFGHHLNIDLSGISADALGKEILSLLGSDKSEAACEATCPTAMNALVPGAGLIGKQLGLCKEGCTWVQSHLQG